MSDSQAGPSRERDRPRPTSAPYLNASSSQRQVSLPVRGASTRPRFSSRGPQEPQASPVR